MDLNQLKKIINKVRGTVIIVENGEPILIVSPFDDGQQQLSLDKEEKKVQDIPQTKIIQSTELLTKQEMPSDELTIEDLPF